MDLLGLAIPTQEYITDGLRHALISLHQKDPTDQSDKQDGGHDGK